MALNPYAPPVADAGPADAAVVTVGIPRDTVRLARLWLVSGAIAFALGGVAALFMRAELWDPGPTFEPATYTRAAALHSIAMIAGVMVPALFGGIGHVFVADAMQARSGPSLRVGVVAWFAWLGGVAALVEFARRAVPMGFDPHLTPGLLVASTVALAAALALLAVQLGTMARAGWASAGASTRIIVGGFVASVGALALLMVGLLSIAPIHGLTPIVGCNVAAGIAVTMHVVARARSRSPSATLAAIVLASTFVAEALGPESPIPTSSWSSLAGVVAAISQLVLAIVLVVSALRSSQRWSPALLYAMLGVAPALVVGGPVQAFLGALTVDVHVHDTYFIVGELHLSAYVAVFAILIAIHTWGGELLGRDAHPMLARAGALLVCGGTLRMAYEMLVLGQAGMPRRYFQYIDTFEPQHRTATLAAAATALGFVFVLVAWLVGRKRTPA